MYRRFVIGDIHGCSKTLEELLFGQLNIDSKDLLFFVGDYIDRGPHSLQVINLITGLIYKGYNIFPARGNHEQMLLDYYLYNDNTWLFNGYKQTISSFGYKAPEDFEPVNIKFFYNLRHYYITDGFIITHAGLNTNTEKPFEDIHSMLWTRDNEIDKQKTYGRKVISGHTPHSIEDIEKSLGKDKIQIDSGCVYLGRYIGVGYLCALDLDNMKLYRQVNIDMQEKGS